MDWLRFIWVLECTAAAGRRGKDSTHPHGSPVLGTVPAQGKELSNCTTFVLLHFFRTVSIPQHEQDQSHRGPLSKGSARLQLCSVCVWFPATPHLKFVQFSCRHISAPFVLLQKGKGVEARWGTICQFISEIYFFSTLTWMLSTVCREKKKSLWLPWYCQKYRGDIASSRKMSFLWYWLWCLASYVTGYPRLLMFANDFRSLLRGKISTVETKNEGNMRQC